MYTLTEDELLRQRREFEAAWHQFVGPVKVQSIIPKLFTLMKSLSAKLSNATKLKSSTNTSWHSFYAFKDEEWETIQESEFYNALYTDLWVKDADASSSREEIYVRKTQL